MDYKQKYEQALEYMCKVYPTLNGADKEDAEHYFPELKESEDERIRKIILSQMKQWNQEALKENCEIDFKVSNKCIAWLEKQGEHNPAWSEEDEKGFCDSLWAVQQARIIAKDVNEMGALWYAKKWLESLKQRMKGE